MLIWPSCGRRRSTMFMSAEDLDAAHHGRAHGAGQVEHVVQRAVDAVPHPDPVGLRLDVDVRGPVAQRLGDDLLHDVDDRRVASLVGRRAGAFAASLSSASLHLEGLDLRVDAR